MLNFYSLLPKRESMASTSMPAALLWSKETETAMFAFILFAFMGIVISALASVN
jgi:hypothetical protein